VSVMNMNTVTNKILLTTIIQEQTGYPVAAGKLADWNPIVLVVKPLLFTSRLRTGGGAGVRE
jgi:hypothetical protein